MSVHEAASGLNFILSTLRNDPMLMSLSPGGIFVGAAPIGATFPCTLVSFQSGIDVVAANAKRLMVDALYQVKGVGVSSDPDAVVALASQIDDTLGGDEGLRHVDVTGGHILSCQRRSPLLYNDIDKAGTQYMHIGGIYRVRNQQKPS